MAFQETEEFKTSTKNSELKNPHSFKAAKSASLFRMEIQGAETSFVVNLKRQRVRNRQRNKALSVQIERKAPLFLVESFDAISKDKFFSSL